MRMKKIVLLGSLSFLFLYCTGGSLRQGGTGSMEMVEDFKKDEFGTNPGNLGMYRYLPAAMPAKAPLVVALHGCNQDVEAYEAVAQWTVLAEKYKFYLVYPEQNTANNIAVCFNWFSPAHNEREKGEVKSIRQMIARMQSDFGIDEKQIFITGISAGGAMTLAMLASYPELFASGAVMEAVPYKAADFAPDPFKAMQPGVEQPAEVWGKAVAKAYPGYKGSYPALQIFHGTKDYVCVFKNLTEIMKQWTAVHQIEAKSTLEKNIQGHTHKIYQNQAGKRVVETFAVEGLGHMLAVHPGNGKGQGGQALKPTRKHPLAFAKDVGFYAPYWALVSWGLAAAE